MISVGQNDSSVNWEYKKWLIYLLFAFLVSAMIIYIPMSPLVLKLFIANADTPIQLLKGYACWNFIMSATLILTLPMFVFFGVKSILFYCSNFSNPKYKHAKYNITIYGLPLPEFLPAIFITGFWAFILFIFYIDNTSLWQNLQNYVYDINALRKGYVVSSYVHINSNYKRAGFESNDEDSPETLTRYAIIDADEYYAGGWNHVYAPDYISFPLDQEHFYNEYKSIDWNLEHSTIYHITYTPRCKLVTSIEIERIGDD